MRVQPFKSAELRVVPQAPVAFAPRVAVLLNANARRVTEKVVRALSHAVSEEDLFLSRSQLDARRIAQTVVQRRYDTVFCGGGDGTFVSFVNEILNVLDQKDRGSKAPSFGILKLGTGNSLAGMVNASPLRRGGVVDDVLKARAGEVPGYRTLDLLSVEGKRTPFAGLGIDGKILNDYIWVKKTFAHGPMKKVMSGGPGYFASVAFRTLPHYLSHSTWVDCEVVNGNGCAAYRLGPDGFPVGEPIAPGGLIYRGKLIMAAAGTAPNYGFDLKMFPFAGRRKGMMHLRLGAAAPTEVLANLGKLWKGTWSHKGLHDFHARKVHIRFGRPMPFQIGGDAEGYREKLTLEVSPDQVELLDFGGLAH